MGDSLCALRYGTVDGGVGNFFFLFVGCSGFAVYFVDLVLDFIDTFDKEILCVLDYSDLHGFVFFGRLETGGVTLAGIAVLAVFEPTFTVNGRFGILIE